MAQEGSTQLSPRPRIMGLWYSRRRPGAVSQKSNPYVQAQKPPLMNPQGRTNPSSPSTLFTPVTSEIHRFLQFPPELQRQMLKYGARWLNGISK